MKRPRVGNVRRAWITVLASLFALLASAAAAQTPDPTNPLGATQADPAIRSGTLANGMRFVILRHAPARREVSLRLRIGAGSLQEPPGQNGVAHLLEHMAFRGSTHVAESEIWRALARLGVAFGADSNAFTVANQTYFQFDLPESGKDSVDTGLMLMREIASELTLSPASLNDERNVVLAEARLTDSPGAQADRAQTAFWFEGQPEAQTDALGDVDVIKQLTADQLRAFYNAYYRPERATLLVVGDIDPVVMEAQIRARFSDWAGKGPPGADPVFTPPLSEGVRTSMFVQPGAPSSVRLAWISPDAAPGSDASVRRRLIDDLAIQVLNRRLAGQGGQCLVAGAGLQHRARLGRVVLVTIDCPPGQWRNGLESIEKARRQILKYGVEQAEIDHEVSEALHARQIAAAAAETMPTAVLANILVDRINNSEALTNPAQELAIAASVYGGIDVAQVNEAMGDLFLGAGPLVFLSGDEPIAGGNAALAAVVAKSEAEPVSRRPRVARAAAMPIWPYSYFGPAGAVVERHETADLNTSFIRFENGVRLTVRPSTFSGGQILVQVAIGHGRLDLPRDHMTADWSADGGAIDAGGLKAIDRADMRRALAAFVYSFTFSTADDSFNLSGLTRPSDLDIQLQVLAAYATEPGWRPGVFEHVQSLFTDILPQFEASPGGVLGDYIGGLLHADDPRWATPNMADVAAARSRDLRALLEQPLSTGAIEVTVVGDVTVERAIQAVGATFGALPPRPPDLPPPPDAYQVRFPTPTASPVVRYHGGHADQALALAAWPIGDAYAQSPGLAEMRVLQQVLNNRLIERLRIADGATYTPRGGLEASRTFPGFGYLYAAASVAPAQIDLVFDRIRAICADLRANDISADELERARKPALAALERSQESDAYWVSALSHTQTDPRRLDLIRFAVPALAAVTRADIRRAARTYLRDETIWKLIIVPHASASPTNAAP